MRRRGLLQRAAAAAALGTLGTGTAGATGAEGNLDRYNVVATDAAGAETVAREAASVDHLQDFGRHGSAVTGRFSEETVQRLSDRPDVRSVRATTSRTSSTLGGQTEPSHLATIHANQARHDGFTGNGAKLAIIDTGIDKDHPDLDDNLEGGIGIYYDDWGGGYHGTGVAGVAGAEDNDRGVVGVAPDINLYSVNIAGDSDYLSMTQALSWAIGNDMDAVNISLPLDKKDDVDEDDYEMLQDIVNRAYEKHDILIASAVGNYGSEGVDSPATYGNVIAVGGSDGHRRDSLERWDSSNWGPSLEILAPAVSIPSTKLDGGTFTTHGTSYSSPMVAAAGAILISNGFSAPEARERLGRTATWNDDWPGSPRTKKHGKGVLNVDAAVDALRPEVGLYFIDVEGREAQFGLYLHTMTADSAEVWFRYWEEGNPYSSRSTPTRTVSTEGYHKQTVQNLDYYTDYRVQAHVYTDRGNRDHSEEQSFNLH